MGGWPAIRVSRFVSKFRAGRLWLASHPRLASLCPDLGPVGCGWTAIPRLAICVRIQGGSTVAGQPFRVSRVCLMFRVGRCWLADWLAIPRLGLVIPWIAQLGCPHCQVPLTMNKYTFQPHRKCT